MHVVVKVVLQRSDVWEDAEHHFGVATLVNIGWSAGVAERVRETSDCVFGSTAATHISNALGRALCGGWRCIDSIESLLGRTWKDFPGLRSCAL